MCGVVCVGRPPEVMAPTHPKPWHTPLPHPEEPPPPSSTPPATLLDHSPLPVHYLPPVPPTQPHLQERRAGPIQPDLAKGRGQPAVPHKLPARLADGLVAGEGPRKVQRLAEVVRPCGTGRYRSQGGARRVGLGLGGRRQGRGVSSVCGWRPDSRPCPAPLCKPTLAVAPPSIGNDTIFSTPRFCSSRCCAAARGSASGCCAHEEGWARDAGWCGRARGGFFAIPPPAQRGHISAGDTSARATVDTRSKR